MKNRRTNSRGSILIWSVMLGVILTSVFFFFGSRLQKSALLEREVMEHQNAKRYLESYAAFLKHLPPANLNGLNVDWGGMTGTVTQNTSAIEGFLENGGSSPATFIDEEVIIEWNRCDLDERGDLLLSTQEAPQYHEGECDRDRKFRDSFTVTPQGELVLTAFSSPFHYQITTTSGNPLSGNEWNLSLSIPLNFRKTIELKETFTSE